ncbi:Ig-like domain-containing protein [Streptomyces albidus (ex Kaewkla and Franco 2022)]|uniref:Ig-like domain-containing protein n=1 Tax=Streptomyces albidus (ex Kaewkla and Franco 2022) TaxID=722709 RepID=UPI0015EE5947|nr:Ig-like domain-containing protein [Streptomyces albidus (ex Kaewkla and Franco 2022)]
MTASPASSVFGQPALITATVTSLLPGMGTPTGTVTFVISGPGGGTYTVPLNANGKATVTTSGLSTGAHIVTATYNGSAQFTRSTGSFVYGVLRAATSTHVSSSPNPSPQGTPVTFTATVTAVAPGAGTPSGTVTFVIDALPAQFAQLDANGVATVTVPALPTGPQPVIAIYTGSTSFLPSTGNGTQNVTPVRKPTTTTVTSSPDPSVFGQPVTLSATVAPVPPGTGTPTGTVTFTVSGSGGGTYTAPLNASGIAGVTIGALGPGTHNVTASYGGDAGFAGSTGSDAHTVDRAATSTSVVSSPDPSVFGQDVTFTATVVAVPPGAGIPTGDVVFTVEGTGTFTVQLAGDGTAALTLDTLPAGGLTVTGAYQGDAEYAPSDGTDTHTVNRSETDTTVTSSPDPSVPGQGVAFIATVTAVPPGAGIPTGNVVFTVDGGPTLTGALVGGQATVITSALAAGSHTVTAAYQGDAGFAPSSGTDTHTVTGASTTTTVNSAPDPSAFGQSVTVTAVVSPVAPATGVPTGTVTFDLGGETFTAALDSSGVATVTDSALPTGSLSITAAYSGDANFLSSTGIDTHTVNRAATSTTLTSSPDPSVFGQEVVFTASVGAVAPGAGVPSGSVTFADTAGGVVTVPLDGSGVANFVSAGLNAGTYSVVATYSGDADFAASSGADPHTVDPAATTITVNSSPEPTVFGEPAVFTATVAPVAPGAGTPSGTVTFTIDGTTTLTGALNSSGTATVSTASLTPGLHTVTASYSAAGDPNFTSSTGGDTHTVNPAGTTTTVISNPDPTVFGQPVTFTAHVAPVAPGAGTPTGTVTFALSGGGGTRSVPVAQDGTAQATFDSLPAGSYSVTATYSGDGVFVGSSGTDSHTVDRAATATVVSGTPDPSAVGQSVTISATVFALAPGAGTPSGTVTFVISGAGGGTFTESLDVNGTARLVTSVLGLGSHSITATYNGDGNFVASSATDTHTVEVEPSNTTTVTSSPDPSVFGQPVTITATVTPSQPGPVPTGTVTFVISGTGGGTFTENLDANGTAQLVTNALGLGSHSITATYGGDADYDPSSGSDTHSVNSAATTTVVNSTPDPTVFGQSASFTATVAPVAPGAGTPSGTVTFTIDGTTTLTGALNSSGTATVSTNTLAAGSHTVEATYNATGDPNFTTSTGTDTHTVLPAGTTTSLSSAPDPSVYGQAVTFTATVASDTPGPATPTGAVTFVIDGGGVVTVPADSDGVAVLTLNSLAAGSYSVTAAYGGDANFGSSSGGDTQTVNQAATSTTVFSSPDPSVFGQSVVFAAVTSAVAPGAGTPTGTVTFTFDGGPTLTATLDASGIAVVDIGSLPAGQHTVIGTYSGDANFAASSGADTHTVDRAGTSTSLTSAPDPSVFGQEATFTVTVTAVAPGAGTPSGTVTVSGGTGESVTVALDAGGVATGVLPAFPAGSYALTAAYSGDPNFLASTGIDTHTVNRAATSTTLTSSPDPSVYGEEITLTVTVAPVAPGAGIPTGSVSVSESGGGSVVLLLDSEGTATYVVPAAPPGTYSLTASYNGDTNFVPSSGSDTHVINPADTTTTVNSSPDPTVFGEPAVFTATVAPVAPGAGAPSGSVTFTVDGTTTLTGTLDSSGTATVSTNALPVGSHTVEAVYAGDPNFTSSTGSDTHTVEQALTTTSVTSSPDPSVFGRPVTFTATVAPVAPGAGAPTGTVTFALSGGGGTTSVPVSQDGTAQLILDSLPAGSYSVTATYSGDGVFVGSSGTDSHTVDRAATATTVTSSPDPSAVGQSVTVSATVFAVTPGAGTPSGTVTFVISGTGGGTFTENLDVNGTAQLVTNALGLGSHSITATYNGDGNFVASSATDTHTVEVEPSNTTTVTSSPDPSVFGQPVTITATVTPSQPGPVPTGTVTFVISGSGGGTFTQGLDSAGTATLMLDSLGVATHSVTATYSGDADYDSSSGSDTHSVNAAATTTVVNSTPDPTVFGQSATFTATVAPVAPGAGTPSGTVTFTVDGTITLTGTLADGVAAVSTASLESGSHTVTASYEAAGDPNFTASTGTDTHTVEPALTTTSVTSSPDPSVFGQPVTFTALVSPVSPAAGVPTGTITFTVSSGDTSTVPVAPDGTAQVTFNSLPAGSLSVTAAYGGDANFGSSSGGDSQTVDMAATSTTVVSSPDPSVFGQSVVFAAVSSAVAPGAGSPTGTVTFAFDGGPTLTATLDASGIAVVDVSSLPAGVYTVIGTYGGDADFASSSGSDTHTVDRAGTSTSLVSAPDPSAFGQEATFTVTVAAVAPGAGTPSGTVTVSGGTGESVTVALDAGGVATGILPAFPAGAYALTAAYSGDPNFLASTGIDTHTVNRAGTSTSLVSAPDPSVFGQEVVFTASVGAVAPGAGVPSGSVTFADSAGGVVTVPLDVSGEASFVSAGLSAGTYSVVATYSGDADFAASSGADSHTVDPAATTITVNSSPEPTVVGQTVTFLAVVSSVAPGAGTPSGSVTFTVDGTTTLTGTLDSSGTATVSTNTLTAGSHTVEASYDAAGDPNFSSSTGGDTHTVNPAGTTTTVISSPDPTVFGQPVTFTAHVAPVAPGAGTPTGTVTFVLSGGGGTTSVPVSQDGTARLILDSLPADSYSLTATYSGDGEFVGSSGTDTHTVNRASTTTVVSGTPNPSAVGQSVTISATVFALAPGAGTPSGTVTFVISGSGGGTFTENLDANGTAQLVTSALGLGAHSVTGTYSGDADFGPSTGSHTHTVEVEPSNSTTVTSSPDPSVFGEPVTVTATVTPGSPGPTPTGTVTFVISGSGGGTFTENLDAGGTAQLVIAALASGSHSITGTYSGDADYDPSSGSDNHTVNPAATTTVVNSTPDPTVFGQSATFTATVAPVAPGAGTPSGTVTFTIDGTTLTGALNSSGTATVSTNTLAAGSHTVEATYNATGDLSFTTSTGTDTHTVDPADTSTTVISSPDPSVFGQPVAFTALVSPVSPATGVPTGTVTFAVSGGGTSTVPVALDGTAQVTFNSLPSGSLSVTATYNGDTDYGPSTGTDTHTAIKATTTTTVLSTPDPSSFGEPVTLTAQVTATAPGAGTPSGTVTFTIGGGPALTGTLDGSGTTSVTTGTLPVGVHNVTATYSGDADFNPSTGTDTQTVNRVATTTTVSGVPDPSAFGQAVTFTATVTSNLPAAGTPAGTVTFLFDGTTPVTAPLVGGVATVTRSNLTPGTHTVSANYGGSPEFATSNGADAHTVASGATTTTVVSSPDPSRPGRVVTFTATVAATPPAPGTPAGTVTFVIGGSGGGTFTAPLVNGVAVVTNQGMSVGTHAISATYNGNAQFAPSTGTDTHTVSP